MQFHEISMGPLHPGEIWPGKTVEKPKCLKRLKCLKSSSDDVQSDLTGHIQNGKKLKKIG